jgi:hypothetical protein
MEGRERIRERDDRVYRARRGFRARAGVSGHTRGAIRTRTASTDESGDCPVLLDS